MTDIEHQVATAFAADVAEHRMIVRLDHGVHRHIVFEQREHSWNNRFELVTYPGKLVISGDRGAYVFSRMYDMFQFFRRNGNEHSINASYWAEKLPDGRRSVQRYSEDTVLALVKEHIADWVEGEARDDGELQQVRELVADFEADGELMYEDGARRLLGELEHLGVVSDTWEWALTDWDYHFLWCLHAIAWGVQQYDHTVKTGLHVVRTGTLAWDVPLPTVAPAAPEPLPKPKPAVKTLATIGGVL
jgi:hypothetical protein